MNDMLLKQLNLHLDGIDTIKNSAWLESLDDRKRKELEFHNRDRDRAFIDEASQSQDTFEKFYGNKKYYGCTSRSRDFVSNWIATNAKDKVFLDYACGNGANAILAAKSGAAIAMGLDISDVSIRNARQFGQQAGCKDNLRFFQADAENTKLPDACVDTVICSGMLHHLDLNFAFPELKRILKPGGRILCVEALDYNPLIKLYRVLTPQMRTEWEMSHILSLRDLDFAGKYFSVENVRYWHILGYVGGKFPFLAGLLDALDRTIERIPYFNRMAWIFTFELVKKS